VEQAVTPDDVFAAVATYIKQKPELVDQTGTSFQFEFSNPDQQFFIDLKNAPGAAGPGTIDKPDVTLALDSEHLETVFGGDLAAVQKLFFGGELKISGNVMASNKLTVLQDMDPKLAEQARDKRVADGGGSQAVAVPVESQEPTMADVFSAIGHFIADNPDLIEKAATSFQFAFSNPDQDFYIDLKNAPGTAGAGQLDKADVTLDLDSKHAPTLFGGDLAAVQKLFFGGDLKIGGNVMASNKLTVLQDMDPKLVEQARDKRLASGQPDTATAQPKKQKAPQAEKVLPELAEKLSAIGGQGGVLQIKVRSPDSAWFIDLSASSPGIVSGEKDAAAVITLDDSKLADLIAGKVALSTLYQKGDMRVDGDLALVRKLEQIL
jgi:3-hydroxyacyl-CoA dehydrogenase/3a,7a,12a-trihydroxy-5b-cholest-24-enoyl-CoA hydratase